MNNIQHCQVLGPFNSGTSLMQRYLRGLFRNLSPDCFPFWKHSLPPAFYSLTSPPAVKPVQKPPERFPAVLFVCMVRSPYFWVNSTSRRPYNLAFQTRSRDMEDRLRCPVVFRKNQQFRNIIQVWNHYYRRYAVALETENHVVYIRLEDLVNDTANTLQKLGSCLQRKPGSDMERVISKVSAVPSKPYNAHGEVWEKKNRSEHLYKSICNRDLAFINQQLDSGLMEKFGYKPAWPSPSVQQVPAQ